MVGLDWLLFGFWLLFFDGFWLLASFGLGRWLFSILQSPPASGFCSSHGVDEEMLSKVGTLTTDLLPFVAAFVSDEYFACGRLNHGQALNLSDLDWREPVWNLECSKHALCVVVPSEVEAVELTKEGVIHADRQLDKLVRGDDESRCQRVVGVVEMV